MLGYSFKLLLIKENISMETTRQKKVSRLLQKEISEMFLKEVKTLALGTMVSVSQVRVTPDMAMAKVYISIFPSDNKEEVFKEIVDHSGKVRRDLGLRVGKQLRIIPELQFYIDDSLDYIENLDRLIKE